jgi:hypothetical protein
MRTLAVIASKSFTDGQGRPHGRGDVFSLPIVDALKAIKRRDVKPAPKIRAATAALIPEPSVPSPVIPEPVVTPEPELSEEAAEPDPLQPESPVVEDSPRRKRAYRRRDLTPEV